MKYVVVTNYLLNDKFCLEMFLFRQGSGNFMYEHELCTKRSRTIGKPPVEGQHPCGIVCLRIRGNGCPSGIRTKLAENSEFWFRLKFLFSWTTYCIDL